MNDRDGTIARYQVQNLQDLHCDQRDVVWLPLLPDVVSHFDDDALADFRSRSARQAAKSIDDSVVAEIIPTFIRCLRDAVAENQQPISPPLITRTYPTLSPGTRHIRKLTIGGQILFDGAVFIIQSHGRVTAKPSTPIQTLPASHKEALGASN